MIKQFCTFPFYRNKHEHAGAAERSPGGQQPDVPPARGDEDGGDVGEPVIAAGPAAAAAHDRLAARQHVAYVRGRQRRRLRLRQVVILMDALMG